MKGILFRDASPAGLSGSSPEFAQERIRGDLERFRPIFMCLKPAGLRAGSPPGVAKHILEDRLHFARFDGMDQVVEDPLPARATFQLEGIVFADDDDGNIPPGRAQRGDCIQVGQGSTSHAEKHRRGPPGRRKVRRFQETVDGAKDGTQRPGHVPENGHVLRVAGEYEHFGT